MPEPCRVRWMKLVDCPDVTLRWYCDTHENWFYSPQYGPYPEYCPHAAQESAPQEAPDE
mgnify:CR=1 FL=1